MTGVPSFAERTSSLAARSLAAVLALALSAPIPARADESITPPQPLSRLHAEYPERASGEHDVLLELLVAADGSVQEARVVEGQAPFTDAALAAAKGFRFTPARSGDRPVRARIRASIHFTPPPPPSAEPAPTKAEPPRPAPLEVVILGNPRAPGAVALGRAEVRVLPGAFGDPFRAIETLPGVTPTTSGAPYFYVRGAPPGNVGYFLDDIRLPSLFHVLLGPAVLPPALIDRVELYPGGYPAQYGRFAGGVLAATTRPPATELHVEGSLRLVDAGVLAETPLPGGRGSALAGARYSYTSAMLSLFTKDLRFDYWDYQARISLNLSARERLTLFVFGSHDNAEKYELGAWTPLVASDFHRIDVRYDGSIGERTRITHGLTLGFDRSTAGVGTVYTQPDAMGVDHSTYRVAVPVGRDTSLAARSRVIHRLSDAVLLRAGADAILDSYVADVGQDTLRIAAMFTTRLDLAAGVFVDAVIDAGRGVELTPGLRLDLWSSGGNKAITADPRFALRIPLGDRVRLIDAVGLAHQTPGVVVPIPGLSVANLEGGLQRSFQTSAGVEADLPLSFRASATVFYNAFFNLSDGFGTTVMPFGDDDRASVALNRRTQGSGVGLELRVDRKLSERLGGFLSYTLSRSTRYDSVMRFASRSDRTHVLQTALSWEIGRGFRVGARGTLLSGRPLDPFYSYAVPYLGTNREPPFFRLDARFEKRWTIGKRGFVSLVVEMLNATLAKEPNGVSCNLLIRDAGSCKPDHIGPVTMPSLGVEGGL